MTVNIVNIQIIDICFRTFAAYLFLELLYASILLYLIFDFCLPKAINNFIFCRCKISVAFLFLQRIQIKIFSSSSITLIRYSFAQVYFMDVGKRERLVFNKIVFNETTA